MVLRAHIIVVVGLYKINDNNYYYKYHHKVNDGIIDFQKIVQL